MRNKAVAIFLTAGFVCCLPANAKVVKGYSCQTDSKEISLTVDSIDFRSDLARLYGKLRGKPHTAYRIDNMKLEGAMSPKAVNWTDAEGIDMNRWFQWEDSGTINVEIDFPPLKNASSAIISVTGPKGSAVWKVTKPIVKKKVKAKRKHRKK